MSPKIENVRVSYENEPLRKTTIEKDPFKLFGNWLNSAVEANIPEPNAMTLATADSSGRPSARMVLLKDFDVWGFVFYTNYSSNKGMQLEQNPYAALVFWWDVFSRQVRIEGRIKKLKTETSDDYFHSRPHGSQLGALASNQSQIIPSYNDLEKIFTELSEQFEGKKIPRPAHWGGYLLEPDIIEFWQGRPNRLHDRLRFIKQDSGNWQIVRLAP